MPNDASRKTAFYSWQSDLPKASNLQLIRTQLRAAISRVEEDNDDLVIDVDEATRDLPGSPHIPTAITEKIRIADYFICDVSTINREDPNARKSPNPNVVFELGYAVATLGWGRIVMLVNKEFGGLSDLPFDFDRQRASAYMAGSLPTGAQKAELRSLLTTALAQMVKSNPAKPGAEMTPEQSRRARDITNLRELLSVLHVPTLDEHLERAPHMLLDRVLDFWEYFNIAFKSSMFHLYDESLLHLLHRFHRAFHETVRHGEYYHPNPGNNAYIFTNPGDMPLSGAKEKVWNAMEAAVEELARLLPEILSRVRNDYIEIDLEETNRAAWRLYRSHQQELLAIGE